MTVRMSLKLLSIGLIEREPCQMLEFLWQIRSAGHGTAAVNITNLRTGAAPVGVAEQGIRLSITDGEIHAKRDLNANHPGNHGVFGGKNATIGHAEVDEIFGFHEVVR